MKGAGEGGTPEEKRSEKENEKGAAHSTKAHSNKTKHYSE